MESPKLKYKLIKLEQALVFQILQQHENFLRKERTLEHSYRARNGWVIKSELSPNLNSVSDKVIYLRGSMPRYHFIPTSYFFDNNLSRDAAYDQIQEALKDWSINAPEFGNLTNLVTDGSGTFTLL